MAKTYLSLTMNSAPADAAVADMCEAIKQGMDGGLISGIEAGAVASMVDHLAPVMFRTVRDPLAERGELALIVEPTDVCLTFQRMVFALVGKEVPF